jgi:hypothetical protein
VSGKTASDCKVEPRTFDSEACLKQLSMPFSVTVLLLHNSEDHILAWLRSRDWNPAVAGNFSLFPNRTDCLSSPQSLLFKREQLMGFIPRGKSGWAWYWPHSLPALRLRIRRAATLLPPYVFMAFTAKTFCPFTLFSKMFVSSLILVTVTRPVEQIRNFFQAVPYFISYNYFFLFFLQNFLYYLKAYSNGKCI